MARETEKNKDSSAKRHRSRSAAGGSRFILSTQEVLEPMKQPKERRRYTCEMPEGAHGLLPEIAAVDLDRPIRAQPVEDLLLEITTANRVYHMRVAYEQFDGSDLVIKDSDLFGNDDKHTWDLQTFEEAYKDDPENLFAWTLYANFVCVADNVKALHQRAAQLESRGDVFDKFMADASREGAAEEASLRSEIRALQSTNKALNSEITALKAERTAQMFAIPSDTGNQREITTLKAQNSRL
ncbi:hypothetical protein K4K59_009283 [Colletotrichum sp. SAR11_240]|nr:hypothetical protein K4K59_009283 [Colletotrichum sp. SAR11_240]